MIHYHADNQSANDASNKTLNSFFWREFWSQRTFAELSAREVSEGVAGPNHNEDEKNEPGEIFSDLNEIDHRQPYIG